MMSSTNVVECGEANIAVGRTTRENGNEGGDATTSIDDSAVSRVNSNSNNNNNNNNNNVKPKVEKECVKDDSNVTIKPVSRPPYIPPHLMGRDLNDPAQDMIGTGRRVQKPRLGVKVPYRNLTSQIVSQDEIAQEILERSLRKYSYSEVPEGGDVFFAMKLTHRLANKITPSAESCNDRAGNSGITVGDAGCSGGGGTGAGTGGNNEAAGGAVKKTEIVAESIVSLNEKQHSFFMKRNTAGAQTANVAEKTNDALVTMKYVNSERKSSKGETSSSSSLSSPPKTSSDGGNANADGENCSNDPSKSDSCANYESKADQLYAEISSTLGEECKIAKPLKIASSNANTHPKSLSTTVGRVANGSLVQTTTNETELDNDTLLAILEGTSDLNDVSMNVISSTPKVESKHKTCQPTVQQQPQPVLPSSSSSLQPQPQQQQQQPPPPSSSTTQQLRKKRIKPMLDPNVEKELALKQLMDFETKKNEDRLKKTAAKKLKLDEECAASGQQGNVNAVANAVNNENCSNSGNVVTDGCNVANAKVASSAATSLAADSSNGHDGKCASEALSSSSVAKRTSTKKNTFGGGSVAPKRFPKKYQRIIKRQLRSSKLKVKTASPDQQQKRLPEVPEVQIAIDRYIKTYASKRKHKPEANTTVTASKVPTTVSPQSADKKSKENGKSIKREEEGATASAKTVAADEDVGEDAVQIQTRTWAAKGRAGSESDENANCRRDSNNVPQEDIKENESPSMVKTKANSKVMREINRLLGDEGAINMIYSIEQKRLPDSKRDTNILPSLRRKKKDLLLKTKLVKNAVLRLSMSPAQLSPGRIRRTSPETNTQPSAAAAAKSTASPSRKTSIESVESNASASASTSTSEPSHKMRKVAAEASRIIRRHSSSSAYSSDEEVDASCTTTSSALLPVVTLPAVAAVTTTTTTTTDVAAIAGTTPESGKCKSTAIGKNASLSHRQQKQPLPLPLPPPPPPPPSSMVNVDTNLIKSCATTTVETRLKNRDINACGTNGSSDGDQVSASVDTVVVNAAAAGDVDVSLTIKESKTAIAERKESASVNNGPLCVASSSKRKDSKEEKTTTTTTTVANEKIQTQNDASTSVVVGSYTELVEQLNLKEITVRKYDNLVQIILISSSCKMKNAMNIQVFNELTKVLDELQKDENCRTVLVTSTGSCFCQGIDLQALICSDKTERRKIVNEYVTAVSNFTKCLSQFQKVLIAGVHGSAVGLGVTMLPFFDMVFASDKATFYTPYVKLGQIPEAGATLTLPHLLGNAVTSELLFGCRMLTASEALQFGLVTRILWPDKFGEELLPIARGVAGNSSQSMEATKSLLRQTMNEKLHQQLNTEAKLLETHWCSDECQQRFTEYLQQEALLQNK